MSYSGPLYRAYHWLASIPPRIQFKNKDPLTANERQELINLFAKGYYIILTGNSYHASSVAVKAMTFAKTGKWTRYSHALMNCDYMSKPEDVDKFKFMEATVKGVHYSTFDQITDCDSICVLTPKNVDNEDWTAIIDKLVKQQGKPYDDLFHLADESHISCVELVRSALMADKEYEDAFGNFEDMIVRERNLLPQMFRDCQDFEVVYENK